MLLSLTNVSNATNEFVMVSTNSEQCYITGNVEIRIVSYELEGTGGSGGYRSFEVRMVNKNSYYANISIYLTADGERASSTYRFVLDPKEDRTETLCPFETIERAANISLEYTVTKCD